MTVGFKNTKVNKSTKQEDKLKENYEMASLWDDFIEKLLITREAWKEIMEARLKYPFEEQEQLDPFTRRCLATFIRIPFEKMIFDFIKYVIQSGGFETIYTKKEGDKK